MHYIDYIKLQIAKSRIIRIYIEFSAIHLAAAATYHKQHSINNNICTKHVTETKTKEAGKTTRHSNSTVKTIRAATKMHFGQISSVDLPELIHLLIPSNQKNIKLLDGPGVTN